MRRFHPQEAEGIFTRRALAALILPLIAEQFLAVLVGMADTAMVSGVGDSAVAAVSTVDTINLLFIQLFSAMSAGGSVVAAQYLGKKDEKSACAAARHLILGGLILSTAVAVLCAVFHKPLVGLLDDGSDLDTLNQSYTYLVITALSFPFLAVYNGGVGLLRAMGNSKASMWTSIAMNIINIGGNALLIHPCGLGVAGAAISTLLSRAVSAVIILRLMFQPSMPIHLEPIRKGAGFFRIMGIITTFPTAIRAANGICNSISGVVNIPGTAIGLASVAVIGQLIGAGKKEEARKYGKKLTALMFLCILPTNLALLFLAEPAVRLFSLSEAGVPVAVEIERLYAVCSITTWPLSWGIPNILRAAGDARFSMTVSMISMLVLRVAASYLLVYGLGLSLLGVWIAMHLDWLARGVCFVIRFSRNQWLDKKVI